MPAGGGEVRRLMHRQAASRCSYAALASTVGLYSMFGGDSLIFKIYPT